MKQTLSLPKWLFAGESKREERRQKALNRLDAGKFSWEKFLSKVQDPLDASHLASEHSGRTLLHLAVLSNRLDILEILHKNPSLKMRLDSFGLSALDLARFLNRKEALRFLHPIDRSDGGLPVIEGFEYLPYPMFESKECLERILAAAAKAKKGDKIPSEKIWMGIYFDKEIRGGIHPPVEVRFIDDGVGYGVYAKSKIAPCSFVGEYAGIVKQMNPKELKGKQYCLRYTIWGKMKKNFVIDAENRGNFTRFLNHSSTPNLGLESVYWKGMPRMIFVALKEIRKGMQLTFDYGPLYWKEMQNPPKNLSDDH